MPSLRLPGSRNHHRTRAIGRRLQRATYRFSEPVQVARFRRPENHGLRSLYWHVTPGAGGGPDPDHSLDGDLGFSSADGSSFREVVIDIPKYARESADYDVFDPFTDGSTLLYTGHFDVIPMICRHASSCDPKDLEEAAPNETNRFMLVPRTTEHLSSSKALCESARRDSTATARGNWACFGNIAPVQSPQLLAVLDPGLPSWLRTKLGELLPSIFTYYAGRTGQTLHPLPTVFLNFQPASGRQGGRHRGGDAASAMCGCRSTSGRSTSTKRARSPSSASAYLFAHEGAHLWNDQMFPQDGETNDWMHEGGADAFAFRAMLHFGVITRERYEEELSEALSTCLLALDGRPVRELGDRGRYEAYYPCGSTIGLWTEAALRARAPRGQTSTTSGGRIFAAAHDRSLRRRALLPHARIARRRGGRGVHSELRRAASP